MMIKLSKTFEIVTPESAEAGDFAATGFVWEDVEHGFRETVEIIRNDGFTHGSDSHGVPRWLNTESQQDCETGDYESFGLHPGRDAQSLRYWAKACRAAGVIRG